MGLSRSEDRYIGATACALLILVACQSASVASVKPSTAAFALSSIERSQLSQLEARPLAIPQMPESGDCPAGPQTRATPFGDQSATYLAATGGTLYGVGPVFFLGGPGTDGEHETYFDVTVFTDPTVRSMVLIRGQQLGGRWKVIAVGQLAAGPLVGADVVNGQRQQLHSEVAIPADRSRTKPSLAPGWSYWEPRIGIDKADTHPNFCIGFQIDTPITSEIFVVG